MLLQVVQHGLYEIQYTPPPQKKIHDMETPITSSSKQIQSHAIEKEINLW